MKLKALKIFRVILIITFIAISWQGFSQTPPPPPGGSSGSQNNPNNRNGGNGGGAPIGGGLLILVALGAGYGARKVYDYRKRELAE